MWQTFKEAIFFVLKWIESYVGDWGMAIIVLTTIVRLALTPLTYKQTKSMYEMQRIQPKIKELQEKYKGDKEKLQEETLKFYQENKVNPFGGCLPMLIQMPLLIALYQVLGGTAKKPGMMMKFFTETGAVGRFYFLIPDIAKTPHQVYTVSGLWAALPYLILVVIFGLSIWLPQQLMPGEKQQKMIGGYMAVLMLFFGWSAPAGVLLYWDVSSIWGVAQQQLTLSYMKRREAEAAEAEGRVLPAEVEAPKAKQSGAKRKKKK